MVKKYLVALGYSILLCLLVLSPVQKSFASAANYTVEVNDEDYDIKSGQPFQIIISATRTVLSVEETISRILNAYNPENKVSAPFELEINEHGKYTVDKEQCLFVDAEQERVNARGSIIAKVITYPGWRDSLATIAHYAFHPENNTIQASIKATFNPEKKLIALVGEILMNVPEENKIYTNGASIEGVYKLRLYLKEIEEPSQQVSLSDSSEVDKKNKKDKKDRSQRLSSLFKKDKHSDQTDESNSDKK